jgi:hypothetical protein
MHPMYAKDVCEKSDETTAHRPPPLQETDENINGLGKKIKSVNVCDGT